MPLSTQSSLVNVRLLLCHGLPLAAVLGSEHFQCEAHGRLFLRREPAHLAA